MNYMNFKSPHFSLLLVILLLAIGPILLGSSYVYLIYSDSPLLQYKGFFSYYSATIGDAIFLSIAVYYIYEYLNELKYRVSSHILFLSFIISLLLTVSIHIFWMLDSNNEVNWTFNQGLNIFGYIHAFYFLMMLFAILNGLIHLLVILYKEIKNKSYIEKLTQLKGTREEILFDKHYEYIITIISSMLFYSLLVNIDNTSNGQHSIFVSNSLYTILVSFCTILFCSYSVLYYKFCIKMENWYLFFKFIPIKFIFSYIVIFLLYHILPISLSISGKLFSVEDNILLFFSVLFIPLICCRNYMVNLFLMHYRNITPIISLSSVFIYFLSLYINSKVSLEIYKINDISSFGIVIFFLIIVWFMTFIVFGAITTFLFHQNKKDISVSSGLFNFCQNYATFLAIHICILAIFFLNVNFDSDKINKYIGFFFSVTIAFALYNIFNENKKHLDDLQKLEKFESTKDKIIPFVIEVMAYYVLAMFLIMGKLIMINFK